MKTFIIIWFGQFVSRIGTAMTRFALLIWVYQQTGSATTVALLGFFSFLFFVLASPFAGVWVDRLERRNVMLLADSGAGVMTMGVLLLYSTGHLQLWHLYLAGAFEAFQVPAYTAAATVLLPKKHYARAGGLRATANSGAEVIAPFLAGMLLVWLGLASVMAIDIVTFVIALFTLAVVRIPRVVDESETEPKRQKQFWQEMRVGFSYIWQRPGLLYLLLIFAGINLFAALTYIWSTRRRCPKTRFQDALGLASWPWRWRLRVGYF